MKLVVSFKNPDAIDTALEGANLGTVESNKVTKILKKWVEWGEYVHIEVDTDKGTCKLLPAQESRGDA